jgi:hypothetical protein
MGGITSQCFDSKDPSCQNLLNSKDEEINIGDASNFMDDFIWQLRNARPVAYVKKPAGISNIYFSRVSISPMFSAAIAVIK